MGNNSASDLLTTTEQAHARGDHVAALAAALEAWRLTRAACVAGVVVALSRTTEKLFIPPTAKGLDAAHTAWLALVKQRDIVAIGWLAANLTSKLPGATIHYRRDKLTQRLDAILQSDPDPRFALALESIVEHAIVRLARADVANVLWAMGDERTRAVLEEWIAFEKSPNSARWWRVALERLPATTPVSAGESARWHALSGQPDAKLVEQAEALVADVFSTPDDDAPRVVLADRLQELGQPRGELIALQLAEAAGTATEEGALRADAILADHWRTWMGPFADVVSSVQFRRGFPTVLELDSASANQWLGYAKHPLLATVEEVIAQPDVLATFIASPALGLLRRVTIEADAVVTAIEQRRPQTLRAITSARWDGQPHARRFIERILPLLELLPAVDTIACGRPTRNMVDALIHAPGFDHVTRLRVLANTDEDAFALWRNMPAHITEFTWTSWLEGEFRRVDGHLTCTLRMRVIADEPDLMKLADELAELRGLEGVTVEVAPKDRTMAMLAKHLATRMTTTIATPPIISGHVRRGHISRTDVWF